MTSKRLPRQVSREATFAGALLGWFATSARDLPWRRQRTPYSVLVSEMMLQQTTVAAAIPFHERFLERFPDWQALAEASEEDVLGAWSGLGYYRRARSLHATARIVAEAGGRFPERFADALELPGLGPYTAGAVLSLAFGQAHPAVDGNVGRVLSRWLGEPLLASKARDRRRLEDAVRSLQPPDQPGAFNEAQMELGATVCLPRKPHCGACPVADGCRALATDQVSVLPPLPMRSAPRAVSAAAALIVQGGLVLVMRRADTERVLPGQWELPGGWTELSPREFLDAHVLPSLGGGCILERVALVRHVITNRRITLEVHRCTLTRRPAARPDLAWVDPSAPSLMLTTATRRALEKLPGTHS